MLKVVKKVVKYSAICIGLVFLLDLGTVLFFSLHRPVLHKSEAVVVLGAGIYSPALYYRSLKGLELYERDFAPVVALTGGRVRDQDITEATYAQRVMQKNSTQPLNLVLEETSTNTFENLRNAKQKMPQVTDIIIVTDQFHIARSVLTAKSVGFKEVGFASPSNRYKPGELVYHYVREVAAMASYLPVFAGFSR